MEQSEGVTVVENNGVSDSELDSWWTTEQKLKILDPPVWMGEQCQWIEVEGIRYKVESRRWKVEVGGPVLCTRYSYSHQRAEHRGTWAMLCIGLEVIARRYSKSISSIDGDVVVAELFREYAKLRSGCRSGYEKNFFH